MYEAASGMLWNLPEFLCSITSYTFFSTIYTSSLLLMAVSVVRYLVVVYPIAYHQLHKPFYSVVASTIVWLLSTAHCSIVFIIQHHPDLSPSNTSVCYEDFTEQQLAILLPAPAPRGGTTPCCSAPSTPAWTLSSSTSPPLLSASLPRWPSARCWDCDRVRLQSKGKAQ
uniref:G-protein coupled receptors family 1 profile domain-containing protein n=1 Tax=Oncorhynchus tshawytscha TaxID=74940 RepID=A0AAZ3Q2B2_ONCTS